MQNNLYILGAGVSARHVEPSYDQYKGAYNFLSSLSGFPIPDQDKILTMSEDHKNRLCICGSPYRLDFENEEVLRDMDLLDLVINTFPEIVEIQCAIDYSFHILPKTCPEYSFFNYVTKNSLILNLNHDSLASTFIENRDVIPLHGEISPKQREAIVKLLPYIFDIDILQPLRKELLLATTESEYWVSRNENYMKLIKSLENNHYKNIVIIGYSFFRRNPYSVSDHVTLDIIRNYIIEKNPKVIIFDPGDSDFIPDIFSNNLSNLKGLRLNIPWDRFIYALFGSNLFKKERSSIFNFCSTDFRTFRYLYESYNSIDENKKIVFPKSANGYYNKRPVDVLRKECYDKRANDVHDTLI